MIVLSSHVSSEGFNLAKHGSQAYFSSLNPRPVDPNTPHHLVDLKPDQHKGGIAEGIRSYWRRTYWVQVHIVHV